MKKSVEKILLNEGLSKSKKMIELYTAGEEIKAISELMEVRYNFVYNVISNHCRMNSIELRVNKKGDSKKDEIIKLLKEGKSNVEVCEQLKCNYNYVYKIKKEVELSNAN